MYLLNIVVLLFLFLIFATGESVQDKDVPRLKWHKQYTLEAKKLHLVSGLVENIKYWRSSKISRMDYNHGAVKTILIAAEKHKFKDYGIKYEIYPQTTKEYYNRLFCYYTKGTRENRIKIEEMLPSPSEFEYIGKEAIGSGELNKFLKISDNYFTNNKEKTYIWASLNEENTHWVPAKIEELKFDIRSGRLVKHCIWNIINYDEDYGQSVFNVSQYNCTENPNAEEDTLFNHSGNNEHVDNAFARFINDYGRQYNNETEYKMRRHIFVKNLRFVQNHNKKNTTFRLGINKFSDLTLSEIKKLKGLRRRKAGEIGTVPFPYSESEIDKLAKKLPKGYDSRMSGFVTPVEDQATCGSCWTFGTTTAVEGAVARKNGGRLLRLANQALIDCAWEFGGYGCGGGSDTAAYKWIMKYGLPTKEEYGPYNNNYDYCRIRNMTKRYKIKGFTDVPSFNIKALKVALIKHGPITVSMHSTEYMLYYNGGIIFDKTCDKTVLNHEVSLVGYGKNVDGKEYWIVKNSWGRDWGIDGYFHISTRNVNCGITTEPTYVVV